MQAKIAKRWADDRFDYDVKNLRLIKSVGKDKDKRRYYQYLRKAFNKEQKLIRQLEGIRRFKNGDATYRRFVVL